MTTRDERLDVLSLTPGELDGALRMHFAAHGQPAYRVAQVASWIYEGGATRFVEMTDLPAREREALAEAFTLAEPASAEAARSVDGTVKHLWGLTDGELVESVLIPSGSRVTLCLSSQAGCAMGCTFCSTGWGGFRRQLTAGEIVSQYRASRRWAADQRWPPISNLVFMGMGEPLANRKALMTALTILNRGYEVGARRITVSTVGVVPGILELAKRPEQFRLAVSLHAPNSELRQELVPLEKRYPLPVLMDALRAFQRAGGRRLTFEYTMIAGINDALDLADGLADLALDVHAFVNLIPFNPIPDNNWTSSAPEHMRAFARRLEARGVTAAVREPRGRDIAAACGQLRVTYLRARRARTPAAPRAAARRS
ncbi:MAG: 23S rRNA (adenine(2503)-C(2))-methyltransferase RlmN [Gemmatimonadetes bacterium]|nr:23S rRNA (adenine(2503)-C(2))-methyltransferase RlmN [Gemmatimonadota bacterium]